MNNVELNKQIKLSQHFTLGELCKTSAKTQDGNIPSHVHIENLKRLCGWLEMLRDEWNRRYADGRCMMEDGRWKKEEGRGKMGEGRWKKEEGRWKMGEGRGKMGDEPIIINSGYRSEAVNKAVGGVKGSNHLTGCAVDIHVQDMEQLIRYATILLDISDESQEDFDELLLERSPKGSYWLHFAVRPADNRRKVAFLRA